VKIAFDEHIPPVMVKIFQNFASDRQLLKLSADLTIQSAADFYPHPGDADYSPRNDAPWIRRFAAAGGKVVITGNTKMRSVPHERLALVEEGLVVIFFENIWNGWRFFSKCSLLLHWWPALIGQLKTAKPGSFWRIPATWPDEKKTKLRAIPNEDLKLFKIERQKAMQGKIRAERAKKRKPTAEGQGDLEAFLNKVEKPDAEDKKPEGTSEPPTTGQS
jgi:hypothetical protein